VPGVCGLPSSGFLATAQPHHPGSGDEKYAAQEEGQDPRKPGPGEIGTGYRVPLLAASRPPTGELTVSSSVPQVEAAVVSFWSPAKFAWSS
jgi:hypothetical protein